MQRSAHSHHSHRPNRHRRGSALLITMGLLVLLAAALGIAQAMTSGVAQRTGRNVQFLRAEAAAEGVVEVVYGRMAKWVTANVGNTPSVGDAARTGIPGNSTFPALNSIPTFPADSAMNDYTYTVSVAPVLPDDTIVTDPNDPTYLPDLSTRVSIAENSPTSPVWRYYTRTVSGVSRSIPSTSLTYLITVSATPKNVGRVSSGKVTVNRYMRCDRVSPFTWLSYQNGKKGGANNTLYNGPVYAATTVNMSPVKFADSVLYGLNANVAGDTWLGGGQAVQLRQITPFAMIPDLVNSLAHDAAGNRVASLETDTTVDSTGSAPADRFSTRELIEPPTNLANDTTPPVIKSKRIFNQADVRVKVVATTVLSVLGVNVTTVSKTVVKVDGTPVTAAWVPALLAAFNTKTVAASDPNAFIDRSRSTSQAVQVTDIDVGALKTVMDSNAYKNDTVNFPRDAFPNGPTGILYAWDATGLDSGTRPLTGMRLWNGGQLPDSGLVFGTNDPAYVRGDFNTGSTLQDPTNAESPYATKPDTSDISKFPKASTTTTADQRITSDYTVKPAAVFGDSFTELTNAWRDGKSRNGSNANSNTLNMIVGWTSMGDNELRPDDTYLDNANKCNPGWLENWPNARRTFSGEEMVLWHSRYNTNPVKVISNYWEGDLSYDANVCRVPLNWGSLAFVRDRYLRR